MRYWLIPMVMFLVVLVWGCARHQPRAIRIISLLFLLMIPFGIIADFRHPPLHDNHFRESVQKFYAAQPGESVIIRVNPLDWEMRLVKH